MNVATLPQKLQRHGQDHLLRWWHELNDHSRASLLAQIDSIDWTLVEQLARQHGGEESAFPLEPPSERARRARPPADLVRLPRSAAERDEWAAAERCGRELLAAGKVGAILVAGGQGTRLGFGHPKGMFPIGPVTGATLFQLLAEQLLARGRQAGRPIPYFIMTSDATHDETVAFFASHAYFGLNSADVYFFRQGNLPAVDARTGRILMAAKDRLCLSPDGHGGLLSALQASGLFDEMRRRGIEVLHYHQVDNPTAPVCEPAFLGFHALRNSEMSTKVVSKTSPDERMGLVVDLDGRTQIIEYIHLPEDIARRTTPDGTLLLWAGSTAIHVIDRNFLERVAASSALPLQAAHKKVPYIDEHGNQVVPGQENAYKFERFIFDALPLAARALVVEGDRASEFNPVKNAEGRDSPETAQRALSALHARWLRQAGAEVAADAVVEISPLFALGPDDLRGKLDLAREYTGAVYLRE